MKMPGEGKLSARPLHFIWILDCSGSMRANGKIEALNTAIREAIPFIQQEARKNPEAQVLLRALRFSRGAQWHIAVPTPVDDVKWEDVTADAHTDMGKALAVVAEELKVPPMKSRSLPPVLVLVSDGQPTDDFSVGLKKLMDQPWGRAAVRMAVSPGKPFLMVFPSWSLVISCSSEVRKLLRNVIGTSRLHLVGSMPLMIYLQP